MVELLNIKWWNEKENLTANYEHYRTDPNS